MEAGKGGVTFLSLVAIMELLFVYGVAGQRNPCNAECFQNCTVPCFTSPACIASCAITCALRDTSGDNSITLQINGKTRTFIAYSDKPEEGNVNHYCKLGCASSVCSAITTALNLDFSADHVGREAVQGSVERCNDACSELCTERFGAAVCSSSDAPTDQRKRHTSVSKKKPHQKSPSSKKSLFKIMSLV